MAVLIGNRDDIVRTTAGRTVGFKKGEQSWVPDNEEIIAQCLERGHTIAENQEVEEPKPASPPLRRKTVRKTA